MTDLLDDIKARLDSATINERIKMRFSDGRFIVHYTELSALLLSIEGCGVVMEKQKARIAKLEAVLGEILHYTGGAKNALEDEYVMERARTALEKK